MRNKNKRGISPLIATVLLIGFTIVLAALVMKWGGTLFRETTTQTGCTSKGEMTCSSEVTIALGNLNFYTGNHTMNVVINNQNEQDIKAFYVQYSQSTGETKNKRIEVPLTAWNSTKLDFTHEADTASITKFNIIPIFDQVADDGSSCEIPCTAQEQTKLVGDPGVYVGI